MKSFWQKYLKAKLIVIEKLKKHLPDDIFMDDEYISRSYKLVGIKIKQPPNFLDGCFAPSLGLTSTTLCINFSPAAARLYRVV